MKVLIVGANFRNKGAQSMLFVTVSELRKRIPNCEIYFTSGEILDDKAISFKRIYYSKAARQIALQEKNGIVVINAVFRDTIKWTIGKRSNLWKFMELKKVLKQIDLMIDISGFNLGKRWSVKKQTQYLDGIRLAQKYSIPICLMPQSFGPFDYDKKQLFLLREIEELLKYPKVIFAREKDGEEALKNTFQLNNVLRSTDMVLQNHEIDLSSVYIDPPHVKTIHLNTRNNVGIVPNLQCFEHGNGEYNLEIYRGVISQLLKREKIVYIFRHSIHDGECCRKIKKLFWDNPAVILLDQDFSCLEYDLFVREFEFIICSRYHGIVHAYRNGIPCIALGWAVKYQELAASVGQEKYVFDITSRTISGDQIVEAVDDMISCYEQNRKIIVERVKSIRQENCFDILEQFIYKRMK